MIIFWGSKAKEKTLGSSIFFCPGCRLDATYHHRRVSRYFTLYFIPLFAMETLGEYVQCHACGAQFNTSVLQFSREQILSALEPWTCANCNNRNPRSEASCLACGAASQSSKPPPLPSTEPAGLPPSAA